MKILFFIYSLGSGGAERVISVLSSEFSKRGYEVHVALISNRNVYYPLEKRVKLHFLCDHQQLCKSFAQRFIGRLSRIRSLAKQIKPDAIVSFTSVLNTEVCFALAGIDIPIIVSERNDPSIDPASKVRQILRKLAYFKPKHFVFQTLDAQMYFSSKIQERSTIVFNPLTEGLPEPFCGQREKKIVSICRLNQQKNIPLLIDAFNDFILLHPDYTLEIFGDGSIRDNIENYIRKLQLQDRVILRGFCKDVHQQILNASMFVLSSDYEGMPNALMEAMAIGIPCISTDCPCGGPRMLIRHGENGMLIPVAGKEELKQTMCYFADHPEDAARMGKNAEQLRIIASTREICSVWEMLIIECVKANKRN